MEQMLKSSLHSSYRSADDDMMVLQPYSHVPAVMISEECKGFMPHAVLVIAKLESYSHSLSTCAVLTQKC